MTDIYRVAKPYKWIENIEREVTDGLWDDISEHFGVEEISELTEDNIEELEAYHTEIHEDGYLDLISIGIRNIINWWEMESDDND